MHCLRLETHYAAAHPNVLLWQTFAAKLQKYSIIMVYHNLIQVIH